MLTLTTLIFSSDIILTLSPGKLNNCHKIDVLNLSQQYLCGYVIFLRVITWHRFVIKTRSAYPTNDE